LNLTTLDVEGLAIRRSSHRIFQFFFLVRLPEKIGKPAQLALIADLLVTNLFCSSSESTPHNIRTWTLADREDTKVHSREVTRILYARALSQITQRAWTYYPFHSARNYVLLVPRHPPPNPHSRSQRLRILPHSKRPSTNISPTNPPAHHTYQFLHRYRLVIRTGLMLALTACYLLWAVTYLRFIH
jgi:hypothetical protein